MKIGVVLLNWNGGEFTIPCIESLLRSTCPPWLIVVVDNGSTDSSGKDIAKAFPQVVLLREEINIGFTGASNKGIDYLLRKGADFLWILNNDTIVDQHCIEVLAKAASETPGYGVLTNKIFYAEPKDRLWYAGGAVDLWRGEAVHWGAGDIDSDRHNESKPVTFVSGCSMLIRAEVLKQVGGFHEQFLTYYEDTEWCLRALEHGIRMQYIPEAVIWHKVSASQNKNTLLDNLGSVSTLTHYHLSRNRLYTMRLHACGLKKLSAFMFHLAHNCYLTAGFLLFCRWSKLKALWKGFYHGMVDQLDDKIETLA